MPSSSHGNLQSELYVEKLLDIYNQSYLPHVELPKLPPRPDNSDNDNTESVLDHHVAVNSAICTALVLRHTEITPTLRQIQSSLTDQIKHSALIRESVERKVDDLTNKVEGLTNKVEGLDDSVEEIHKTLEHHSTTLEHHSTTLEHHSTTLEQLMGKSDNITNRSLNMRKYKLFQKIELITSYRYNQEVEKYEWWAHSLFPKHLKAFRDLGNHAKGYWTPSEQQLSGQQRKKKQQIALATVSDLCEFYATNVVNDERSESEATEVILRAENVDDFMEALGDMWGLDWEMTANILDEETQQQAKKRRHRLLGYDREEKLSVRPGTE